MGELFARGVAAAGGEAVGEKHGVEGARRGTAHRVEIDLAGFEQAVEHAPGEGAKRAAALQSQRQTRRRPSAGTAAESHLQPLPQSLA